MHKIFKQMCFAHIFSSNVLNGFAIFWHKNIGKNLARQMMMALRQVSHTIASVCSKLPSMGGVIPRYMTHTVTPRRRTLNQILSVFATSSCWKGHIACGTPKKRIIGLQRITTTFLQGPHFEVRISILI